MGMFKTTEGTELRHLVRERKGTTGTFRVQFEDRDKLLRLAHSYAVRNKAKVETESAPIILNKVDVWYIVFVTVI